MSRPAAAWLAALTGWGLLALAGPALAQDEALLALLPDHPGKEEVFYTCSPCHSFSLVRQQNLSRHAWDGLLDWMVEEQGMPEPEVEDRALILDYLSAAYGLQAAPTATGVLLGEEAQLAALADQPGKEEVFYTCSACHSFNLVRQQRLSRHAWDETLDWMVEEQGMAELAPDERALILDYLELAYGQDVPRLF